jgi:hypothetical protein
MIRYHGGPCTPIDAAVELWTRHHALISFFYPQQIALCARVSHSFLIDNGAFSAWDQELTVDWAEYVAFVQEWHKHPGFSWCLIPDKIDGDEKDNDALLDWWKIHGVTSTGPATPIRARPVWRLHESIDRLSRLISEYPNGIALGSSGEFSSPGSIAWWGRMSDAMKVACDSVGRPYVPLRGLRMMDTTIFSHIPFDGVASATVSRNCGIDKQTPKAYRQLPPKSRAIVMALDADVHFSASRWTGTIATQKNMGDWTL